MKGKYCIAVIWITTSIVTPALAQSEKLTTSSLLAQGYEIAGTLSVPSGGAGLFMKKGAKVYFCFVTETRQSTTLSTEYCKPVE